MRKAAETAEHLRLLSAPNSQADSAARESRAKLWSRYKERVGAEVIAALGRPDASADVRSAAQAIEAFAGPDAYRGMIVSRSAMLLKQGLRLNLASRLRSLALSAPFTSEPNAKVGIRMDTERRGNIVLTNEGSMPLHHCLILTRLQLDLQRVREEAQREDAVGQGLVSGGFSPEFAEASRLAARLRHLYEEQDKGWFHYIPEIPAGATISTGFDTVVSIQC